MHTIWTNNKNSNSTKAFKSAVSFRTGENWNWVEKSLSGHLWVLDGKNLSIQEIVNTYNHLSSKPYVVVIDAEPENPLPPSWETLTSPMKISSVFRILDESLSLLELQQTKQPVNSYSEETLNQTPWKSNDFRLLAWPNISKYGSQAHLVITCSNLLRGFYSFESALQWGLSQDVLNRILADAYDNSLLEIHFNNALPKQEEQTSSADSELSLIMKLLEKFR